MIARNITALLGELNDAVSVYRTGKKYKKKIFAYKKRNGEKKNSFKFILNENFFLIFNFEKIEKLRKILRNFKNLEN